MTAQISRRSLMAAGATALALGPLRGATAQTKRKVRFSAAFTEQDLRAEAYKAFGAAMTDDFDFEPFWNNTLFKQGTELVALQRGNLDMCNLAPADISKQIPAWSLMTSAYLFRDSDHLKKTFQSDVGKEFIKMAKDQLGIQIITPVFFGTRNVNLRPDKQIKTPADMAGIKLRMPPGDAWQLLGRSLGANPTPMAFAETYTGLQTGAVDGQDNPLPNVNAVKFYEVMSQIVLTAHLIGYDLLSMNLKTWNAMGAAKQKSFQAAVDKALKWSTAEHLKREAELANTFKTQHGLEINTPDVAAFRAYAQKVYLASDEAKEWPKGMLDKINALK
jgi:TRAP-type C4-dicarboxylate transport system substrate-binding protein